MEFSSSCGLAHKAIVLPETSKELGFTNLLTLLMRRRDILVACCGEITSGTATYGEVSAPYSEVSARTARFRRCTARSRRPRAPYSSAAPRPNLWW